jgi:hypothetical protein
MPERFARVDEYSIRPFEAGDRAGYLNLFDEVFGDRPSDQWFDWK